MGIENGVVWMIAIAILVGTVIVIGLVIDARAGDREAAIERWQREQDAITDDGFVIDWD